MKGKNKPKCQDKNWHHRKPKILGGSGKIGSGNLIQVNVVKHRSWHCLFQTQTPQQICQTINNTWLDPEWELVAVKKEKANEKVTHTEHDPVDSVSRYDRG